MRMTCEWFANDWESYLFSSLHECARPDRQHNEPNKRIFSVCTPIALRLHYNSNKQEAVNAATPIQWLEKCFAFSERFFFASLLLHFSHSSFPPPLSLSLALLLSLSLSGDLFNRQKHLMPIHRVIVNKNAECVWCVCVVAAVNIVFISRDLVNNTQIPIHASMLLTILFIA